ncbi:uncharacterized protein LOC111700088 [Eurytemora carolleeae]|uniref:uncharacterized protein LOC111700088 n=1 Tax=Eurytemora carolleeae TaxID=1294199 RepID=UPI000C772E47|nr:uncharacterized protein LOC111700088 [Eurytemora carolleeae]|eukprot:XP_023326670.1 uncharacterized protein LOC111700088 [Eurytemora affinis]
MEANWSISLLLIILSTVQGQLARKARIANRRANTLIRELKTVQNDLSIAQGKLNLMNRNIYPVNGSATNRHTWSATSTDKVLIVDAYLGAGTKCNKQQITGWTSNLDIYYAGSTVTEQAAVTFNTGTGTFTAPAAGWYNICTSFRFQNSGTSNDVTIKKNGVVVGALGNAVELDWRSTGTCIVQSLAANDQITVHHESGGSGDCIQETGWLYGRFLVNMIANLS